MFLLNGVLFESVVKLSCIIGIWFIDLNSNIIILELFKSNVLERC